MARLPYLDAADLAPGDQVLLNRPINLHRQLVHSPGMARAFSTMGQYIRHGSTLDPRLRKLAILLVVLGFYARVVRVLASLQIDLEPEYQPYLDRFPLPA